jgi:CBS domain-containing protein
LALGAGVYGLHLLARGDGFGLRFALFYLANMNLMLGLFNLLPAFPMDGGRILRAVLAGRKGMIPATRIAATVGKVFAVLFALLGFLSFNLFLMLIAFFIYVGAEAEARSVLVKAAIGKLRVSDLMSDEVTAIGATTSVHDAAERMLRERRLAFPVLADRQVLGVVTLEAIQAVPPERRSELLVGHVAIEVPPLTPTDDAGKALRLMTESSAPQLPVVVDGQLVGTVRRREIIRALKLAELEETQRQEPRWPMRREVPV